ncbi:methyltransferase, putative [Plasmodium knowlesi strain H]|uniref:Methyltransferase, putative n=3 Tax=Plasmodium knowlesi TaxID=5850 RepID=A0A5K1V8A0_PLAKH|nr:methyltransferase, putative [Plasmodium knowlesi strain H]OTN68492.1 putative Methyltransferase [Plasmodium knowlesi]CAA9986479.1 methyltransferase, putative [Plasmodium knowlesi strain H]SBO24267.1 methyltransferase, putative [Plasmodium knowlesi strain H]SBO29726.1 methyltransferase, putative [Plasmodium knowlesi strain H]VVS75953.1 methyltransferase, putative [Plasmodium knowlesi strain H]|eukprot:XP_002261030.1 methyltransferase, putative [Plasmodium knowlesi strain H]
MFTFSSFKKVLVGVSAANGGVIAGCFYIYKKNRPENDETLGEPSESFRIRTFDELAKSYDEKNDFIEKVTSINKYKKRNFRKVKGVVLEIGAGSGRNFSFLKKVDTLVCVEKSEKMCEEMKKKLEKVKPSYPVYIINDDIKNNLFRPNVFDSVISSFTLCSLEDVENGLEKVHQALKPDGKFYLVERGIIYNKIIRYILKKLNLYPNKRIPWEFGYYENRCPLEILKKNNFNVIFKLIKNAGSIYILTAKKQTGSFSHTKDGTFVTSAKEGNAIQKSGHLKNQVNDKSGVEQTRDKGTPPPIDIRDILCHQLAAPIYYSYKNG